MLLATWGGAALNILVFAALVAAVIYLFVLIVRALKKYIGSKEMREEKQALGVSRQTVSKWENGSADPSTTNLLALAKLYGVEAEDLLRGVENKAE